METSQNLHDISFSYGWARSNQPDSNLGHSFNTQETSSFIEMDPDFFSMRWPIDSQNLDFTLPCSKSLDLVHADEIFSNGLILSSQNDSSITDFRRSESVDSSKSLLSERKPFSANSSPLFYSAQSTPFCTSYKVMSNKGPLVRSCADSPKKILMKYLCFLLPLYKKVKGMQLFSGKKISRKTNSKRGSSRRMNSMEWCHGNADTAIYDAILYCKKSIESPDSI